ncbi:hypothetical protein PR048_021227 [Dryococelus australis]|uniref:ATP-dependent DNA helicase PIF1 n=1 Tax=Dryococelus australis TaxID=614101 RepID=A0ABQ9GXL2_9NEOP|nr:hypothetical protein PR048_021227 [Dryococelus australis]
MMVIEVDVEQRRNERAGKREIPEKTHRSTASSGTIPTCENPELQFKALHRNVVEATISLAGSAQEETVFVPRTPLILNDFPFEFKRLQFPLKVCYSMTINKSQGQTLKFANRARFPDGPIPDFRKWEPCRFMSLVGGFSRGSPVFPPLHPGAAPYSPHVILIRNEFRCRRTHCTSVQYLVLKGDGAFDARAYVAFIALALLNLDYTKYVVTRETLLAGRSDEALEVRVSVARIAPSLLDLAQFGHVRLWERVSCLIGYRVLRDIPRWSGLPCSTVVRNTEANRIFKPRTPAALSNKMAAPTGDMSELRPLLGASQPARFPAALNNEGTFAEPSSQSDPTKVKRGQDGATQESKRRGKREISEKTRRPAASSGTVPTCENPGAIPPGLEPGSQRWEASSLTTILQRPPAVIQDYLQNPQKVHSFERQTV